MLDYIKNRITFKSINKNIADGKFDIALEKLNFLIKKDFRPSRTYIIRGRLCKKLMMLEDAYSDFTYVITHCAEKKEAYYERMVLNYEIGNFYEAIRDVDKISTWDEENFNIKRIKFLSFVFSYQDDFARDYISNVFSHHKFKIIQFLFNEVAIVLAKDEFSKGLRLLEFLDIIDKDNPIKLLKESNIFALAGDKNKQNEILQRINIIFPKYFISHFKFSDIYQEMDLLEICFLLELQVFDKQGLFLYPFSILKGYRNYLEGHIINAKENFEQAIKINPDKADAYILLGQVLQVMSGYDNPEYQEEAEINYRKALEIFEKEKLDEKAENMKRQIKHLNSTLTINFKQ